MRKRGWVVIALVALVLAGFIARRVVRPSRSMPPSSQPATSRPGGPSAVQVEGASYRVTDPQGKMLYEIRFASGEYDAQDRLAAAKGVTATLTQKTGPPIIINAPELTATEADRLLRFGAGAKARMADGSAAFAADVLLWDQATRKLIGERGATAVFGQFQASGERLVVDTNTQHIRLAGGRIISRG